MQSGETQCDEIKSNSLQCANVAFATVEYAGEAKTLKLCRLHLSFKLADFYFRQGSEIKAIKEEDQKNVDSLIKFMGSGSAKTE